MPAQAFEIMEQVDLEFFWAALGEAFSAIAPVCQDEANQADALGAYFAGGPL